jgi:hypothetical protein
LGMEQFFLPDIAGKTLKPEDEGQRLLAPR